MFLNFGVDFPVYFGTVADISGIVGKNGVACVRVALMGFDAVSYTHLDVYKRQFLPLSFSKVQSRMVGSVKPRRFSSSTVSRLSLIHI